VVCACILSLTGCGDKKDIVILFDNDVHCAVAGYAQMREMRDSLLQLTPYVSVVSCGDFAQGDVLGSLSHGRAIVDIMNAVPYDVVTLGNHEFDYGLEQQDSLRHHLQAEMVCCNFIYTGDAHRRESRLLYPAYTLREYGRRKVAYIGVVTPFTLTNAMPTMFLNADGEEVYSFMPDELFSLVQQAVMDARNAGADYVVVLSHLGDDTQPYDSYSLLSSTTGIDVLLDGHSHHVFHSRVANATGDSVVYVSTGTRFQYIGQLTLSEDSVSVSLVPSINHPTTPAVAHNTCVQDAIDHARQAMDTIINRVVGYTMIPLLDCDARGERQVRNGETNLFDLLTDAMRWVNKADIGALHGGSIRSSIDEGEITMGELISVLPFNNEMALVSMTGQQLLDALEVSVATYPEENGDFHIFSGLRYSIDPTVPSSVRLDDSGHYIGLGDTRRVRSVEVERNGRWQALDPAARYSISGLNFALLAGGASYMYHEATPMPCPARQDIEVISSYIHYLGDTIRPVPYGMPQNRFRVIK